MDRCQQPQIMQSSVHFVAQQAEPENTTQSRWDLTKHAGALHAQPSLPCAPANKQLIVQPCKSHDITTTEAAICVKTNLVPRIPRISNNPQLLKAIAVTLPTMLSRFSFLLIQLSFPAQDHSSLLLNIKHIFLSQLNSHLAYKTLWNLKTEMVITNL